MTCAELAETPLCGTANCTIKNCMRTREIINGETEMTTRDGKKVPIAAACSAHGREFHPAVERRVIVTWERGHEKALVLGTDLSWHWRKVVAVFKQRMSIEELFRDEPRALSRPTASGDYRRREEHTIRLGFAAAEDREGRAAGAAASGAGVCVLVAPADRPGVPGHYVRGALGFGDHENAGSGVRLRGRAIHARPREMASEGAL